MEEQPKPRKDVKPRFKWWLCTWNNPPQDWKGCLDKFQADFAIGQLEKGANGTLHIQFSLYFRNSITCDRLDKFPIWKAGKPGSAAQSIADYSSKSDTRVEGPYEVGIRPKLKGDTDALLDACFELAKEGRFDEIPGSIKLRFWPSIQKIHSFYDEAPFRETTCSLWLYGPSDNGKTHYVRHSPKYQGAYWKDPGNKWWPGYRGQSTVIFNDVGPTSHYFISCFKSIVDSGCLWIQSKGTDRPLKATRFAVTSNYSISSFLKLTGMEGESQPAQKRFYELFKIHFDYPRTGIPLLAGQFPEIAIYHESGGVVELPAGPYIKSLVSKYYNI